MLGLAAFMLLDFSRGPLEQHDELAVQGASVSPGQLADALTRA